MGLVIPQLGELELLDKMIKDGLSTDENYILKLYGNSYTPVSTSVAGSFTEATFTNYAAATLTRANFQAAVINTNGKAQSTYNAAQSWTCGSTGQTIYGYYVTGSASAVVLWAEQFAVARALASGDVLTLTPAITLASEN